VLQKSAVSPFLSGRLCIAARSGIPAQAKMQKCNQPAAEFPPLIRSSAGSAREWQILYLQKPARIFPA
jgi:hypothetical protein